MGFKDLLSKEFAPFGVLSETQLTALDRHYSLLTRWNQRLNLTRIEKLEDAVRLHYCESLFLARALPISVMRIADIGTGAGFPGFPVAVFRSDCTVDLIESHQRKTVFLREACGGLVNVRVVPERAESLKSAYDWVVSRAVLPSEILSLTLAPRVAILMAANDLVGLKQKPIQVQELPWGVGRVLAFFIDVSRGTE